MPLGRAEEARRSAAESVEVLGASTSYESSFVRRFVRGGSKGN